jgi:hypothetical protein
MICTMRRWILNNGFLVGYIQEDMSIGPCEGSKKRQKRPYENPLWIYVVVELLRIVLGKGTCELNRVSSPPNPAQ